MSKSKVQQENKLLSAVNAERQASNPATYDEIAARAYEIFQARGSEHGADLDDWLQAERELSQRSKAQVSKSHQ